MTMHLLKIINLLFFVSGFFLYATVAIADNKASVESNAVEIEMREWKLVLNRGKVKAGDVGFSIHNTGKEVHEIAVIKLNNAKLKSDQLPVNEQGSIDEDTMIFGEVVGEVEDIKPGAKIKKMFSLQPGRYVLVCNILEKELDGSLEAHYSMGMHALLEVD